MKKKLSKKMMLSITAGALATVAVIGAGTYAWFTSSAEVEAGVFNTATVQLEAAEGSYNVYNFLTSHGQNIEYQRELETDTDGTVLAAWLANVNPYNQLMSDEYYAERQNIEQYVAEIEVAQAEFEAAEAAWQAALAELTGLNEAIDNLAVPTEPIAPKRSDYPSGIVGTIQYANAYAQYLSDLARYGQDMINYYIELGNLYQQLPSAQREERQTNGAQQRLKEAYEAVVKAQQDLIEKIAGLAVFVEADSDLVTPGSLIYGTYTITNESNVPTYFRLAEIEAELNDIGIVKAVAFNGTDIYALVHDGDYYYSPYALAPETEITLIIGAYILGEVNGNDVQHTPFSFGGTEVELIQASNNAVYLDDDWNPANVTFVDYTDPVQP